MPWGFRRGRIYHRQNDIHARFGGQEQGGIITPDNFPLVIAVSSPKGRQHGYHDVETADGVFEYFGAGRFGPMRMWRGNQAIRDHVINGESLLLFQQAAGGLRYKGEYVCEGYQVRNAPDERGDMRQAFVFELQPLDVINELVRDEPPAAQDAEIEALREAARRAARPNVPGEPRNGNVYERSRAVRNYVLCRAHGRCEGCTAQAPFLRRDGTPYLEPHHLRRISDGGPDDARFVIALCPTCHRRAHYAADAREYNNQLTQRMIGIERWL